MDEKTIARFWSKVDKNGPIPMHRPELGKCWVWTASTDKDGYGFLGTARGQPKRAHQVAWVIRFGDRGGNCVLHLCDNPGCVRAEHLKLGTNKDNTRDMLAKRRHQFGARHHNSRLTEADIPTIRMLRGLGAELRQIASWFDVGQATIRDIARGATWYHVK